MSETKYHFKREGNHFNLSSPVQERPSTPVYPKPVKHSIWSRIGSFFGILFSGIMMIFGFLLATPFFILGVLWNWIISFIGLSIFWLLACAVYRVFTNNNNFELEPFNNTSLSILLIISLIVAIMATIGRIRE